MSVADGSIPEHHEARLPPFGYVSAQVSNGLTVPAKKLPLSKNNDDARGRKGPHFGGATGGMPRCEMPARG